MNSFANYAPHWRVKSTCSSDSRGYTAQLLPHAKSGSRHHGDFRLPNMIGTIDQLKDIFCCTMDMQNVDALFDYPTQHHQLHHIYTKAS